MRFLRMLTNSLIAGALGAAFLTIVVLQLNPDMPLASWTPWRWFATIGLLYGIAIAAACFLIIVAREFFTMGALSPGWASVRVLAWLSAALAAGAAVLMWLNARGFEQALDETALRRMTTGAIATSAAALVLLVIAVLHYSFGRRGSRVGAALFTLAAIAALVLPVAARGPGSIRRLGPAPWTPRPLPGAAQDGSRVTMIGLDGASLEFILPRAAEGRLPNFSRIIQGGATVGLATIRPTQPDPVWASIATGMYPSKSGARSAAQYYARDDRQAVDLLPDHCLCHALVRLGLVRTEPRTSQQWPARPLWGVLEAAGFSTGVVRWPLTHPAQPSRGFVVSDQFHRAIDTGSEFDRAAYPLNALPGLRAVATSSAPETGRDAALSFTDGTPEAAALERDRLYAKIARRLQAERRPEFLFLRYEGLDVVGHRYLQFTQQRPQSDVPDPIRREYAQVIERYYTFVDAELGAVLDAMRPGDLTVIVSAFGMSGTHPLKRALARALREPDLNGTHERAPDGFLMAYGAAVQHGRPPRGSIVDVTPTLLYYFGLPVARDMDGFARSDLFTREFSSERPITFIPSYR